MLSVRKKIFEIGHFTLLGLVGITTRTSCLWVHQTALRVRFDTGCCRDGTRSNRLPDREVSVQLLSALNQIEIATRNTKKHEEVAVLRITEGFEFCSSNDKRLQRFASPLVFVPVCAFCGNYVLLRAYSWQKQGKGHAMY